MVCSFSRNNVLGWRWRRRILSAGQGRLGRTLFADIGLLKLTAEGGGDVHDRMKWRAIGRHRRTTQSEKSPYN